MLFARIPTRKSTSCCNTTPQFRIVARAFGSTSHRLRIDKISSSIDEAVEHVRSGGTLLCGGFGLCGIPNTLIQAVHKKPSIKELTVVSNNAGTPGHGLGLLLASRQVNKVVASYVGENNILESMYLNGDLELELTPQGTLAERCRAGGAGIPAFYSPAATGTVVQTGELVVKYGGNGSVEKFSKPKDVRVFGGKPYIMEEAIRGDVAFVRAWKADRLGNCMFRYAAANFNGVVARCAQTTIVEAEHIVEPGELDPAAIHVPGIYVSKVVQAQVGKNIEKVVYAKEPGEKEATGLGFGEVAHKRKRIVRRAAKELKDGMYANLGIGMPMLTPTFLDPSVDVQFQSENGILGLGPYPQTGCEDPDVINAGKETVTLLPGAACFGSDESFGMIRAGKLDLTILGAMQVSATGDLANWMLPGKVKGFGGAMDLVSNSADTKVVITTEHTDKTGNPKIVKRCDFPLTGKACVSMIITDMAVFDVDPSTGLTLIEYAEGVSVDTIRSRTGAPFLVSKDLRVMQQ